VQQLSVSAAGRDHVFGRELVERFLARSPGRAGSLAIIGSPGIGKTTVWQAGLELARAAGWWVLVGHRRGEPPRDGSSTCRASGTLT
jgi:hypothetical protein